MIKVIDDWYITVDSSPVNYTLRRGTGEKDKKGARALLRISLICGAVMMAAVAILAVVFSGPLARLFLNEEDLAFAPAASTAIRCWRPSITSVC